MTAFPPLYYSESIKGKKRATCEVANKIGARMPSSDLADKAACAAGSRYQPWLLTCCCVDMCFLRCFHPRHHKYIALGNAQEELTSGKGKEVPLQCTCP